MLAIPTRPLEQVVLYDATPSSALSYMKQKLENKYSDKDLLSCVEALGGRLTDIESVIQKIRAGASPDHALHDIILKSISELRKIGLDKQSTGTASPANWTQPQFWKIVQLFSVIDEIDYEKLRFHRLFRGDELSIQQMENAGLITILHTNGDSFA